MDSPVHRVESPPVRQAGDRAAARGCGRGPQWPAVGPATGGPSAAGGGLPAHELNDAPARAAVRGVQVGRGPHHRPPRADARTQPRQRFAKDAVLIVDGTLVPTRDHGPIRAGCPGRRAPKVPERPSAAAFSSRCSSSFRPGPGRRPLRRLNGRQHATTPASNWSPARPTAGPPTQDRHQSPESQLNSQVRASMAERQWHGRQTPAACGPGTPSLASCLSGLPPRPSSAET